MIFNRRKWLSAAPYEFFLERLPRRAQGLGPLEGGWPSENFPLLILPINSCSTIMNLVYSRSDEQIDPNWKS